jgi:hypothetical protein
MTNHPVDARRLRANLEPLCRRGIELAAAHDLPMLGGACLELQRTLDEGPPVSDIIAAVMAVTWHWRGLEARLSAAASRPSNEKWFKALAAAATKPRGKIPWALVAELEAQGFKGDGLALEITCRTGMSERTAWRAVRAWRAFKNVGGLVCIVELGEDGKLLVTFPETS